MGTAYLIPLTRTVIAAAVASLIAATIASAAVVASLKQAEAPRIVHTVATSNVARPDSIGVTSEALAITTLQTWFQRQQAATAQHPGDQASQQPLAAEIVRPASADPTMVTDLQEGTEQATHMQSKDGWCADGTIITPCL